jgi:hypothetical protein
MRADIDMLNNPAIIYKTRVAQLDSWLRDRFSRKWDKLLADNLLGCLDPLSNADLSKFHLLANYIIRKYASDGYDRVNDCIASMQPLKHFSVNVIPDIIVIFDHPVIENDLLKIQHPSLPPGSVTSSKERKSEVYARDLAAAAKILNLIVDLKEEALQFFGAVCFVESPTLQRTGECISTSSKHVPGLIYSSEVPPILLAECIVHESAHLQLFCEEVGNDLYNDFDCSIETPLRPDLRPPTGLLHQVFVLTRLKEMYEVFSNTESDLLENSRRQILKRCNDISIEYESGAKALKANRSRYTLAGNKIIDKIV